MKRMCGVHIRLLQIVCLLSGAAAHAHPDDDTAPPDRPSETDKQRDGDLSKRLIHKTTTGTDADIMGEVASLMFDAQNRLVRELDAGSQTQAVQERILQRLDNAIQIALHQRSRSPSRQASKGERREMSEKPQDSESRSEKEGGDNVTDPGESTGAGPDTESTPRERGPFREWRRGWGHLPQRDRDELLQGIEEEFIERYRRQIEQYYRALTEGEEDS